MNWYYVEQGQQAGPVDDARLDELRRSGKIQADTLVWREGMANWAPYSVALGETAAAQAPPLIAPGAGEAVCTECGGVFPTDSMIRYGTVYVCANCKPVFMQKLAEGARIDTGALRYAGFWIRFGAKLLDGLILGCLVLAPLMFLTFGMLSRASPESELGIQLLIQLGYNIPYAAYTIFFVGKYGATPGKMICKIHIVDSSGSKIGYGRATGRFFAEILSGMICYIGYIMAGFDEEKRALHDRICNTRVVFK